jgi:peptidase E
MPPPSELSEKIGEADIVYVTGGDTNRMMRLWRQHKIDTMLGQKALSGQLVITGISAGAIAPMTWGHSDSLSFRIGENETWDYIRTNGLGLLPYAITPHYNTSPIRPGLPDTPRAELFAQMFAREYNPDISGFGIDNFVAVVTNDGSVQSLSTRPDRPDAKVHTVHMDDTKITTEPMSTRVVSAD